MVGYETIYKPGGNIPWNKGLKGYKIGGKENEFIKIRL